MAQENKKTGNALKTGGVAAIAIVIIAFVYKIFASGDFDPQDMEQVIEVIEEKPTEPYKPATTKLADYLPALGDNPVFVHQYYTFAYSEKHELSEWVAYELTKEQVLNPKVERTNNYRQDTKVRTRTAHPDDYDKSGYDRGHLVPAADMAFSQQAMSESFLMGNISPQDIGFNRGIWKELEQQIRDWTLASKHLYIVTGPVLTKRAKDRIGDNDVAVPHSFYKVLLDYTAPEFKAIGFIIPNKSSYERLDKYAMSVDEVEALTGIDFFPELPNDTETKLEAYFNPSRWIYDEERYKKRE